MSRRMRETTRRLVTAVALVGMVCVGACSARYASLTPGERPEPLVTAWDANRTYPIEIEVPEAAYVAVFLLGQDVELVYPLVPLSRLERLYGVTIQIDNDELRDFRSRHPWPHPDSVPDPFDPSQQTVLAAGTHEIERPYRSYVALDTRYAPPCEEILVVSSDSPLGLLPLELLDRDPFPRGAVDRARAILDALGLDQNADDWSARLVQTRCGSRQ